MFKVPLRAPRRAGCSTLETPTRSSTSQQRCFSVGTPRQASHVITFEKTSNKDLDATLLELQNKIILPSYLPNTQRRKMFRPSEWEKLKGNPLEMEIDGTVHKFGPLDFRKGEVPNSRKILYKALDDMKTTEDWDILPKLMQGIHSAANRKLKLSDYPRITRKAAKAGNLGIIIQCAMKPEKTGFKLDTSEKVQAIMSYCVLRVAGKNFSLKATKSALAQTELLLELLDNDAHQPKETKATKDRFSLSTDPQILGTPLMLAAALRVKHSEDILGTVQRYVRAIVRQWPEGKGLLDLHPDESYIDEAGTKYLIEKNKYLFTAAPILKGMDWAIGIVEHTLAKELKLRRDALAAEVEVALRAEDLSKGKGVWLYEKLFAEPKVTKEA